MKTKDEVRSEALARRRELSAEERRKASARIHEKVFEHPSVAAGATICIYQSLPTEVDTSPLIKKFRTEGKRVIVPPPTPFVDNLQDIDVFIVPGVAFDQQGNRVGRGAGYYDRLLAHVGVPKIALAFECQIVSRLTPDRYDIPMDVVFTEQSTYGHKTP